MQSTIKYGWLVVTFFLAALASAPAAEIIPFRSSGWKYVLGTQEASNPTSAWRAPEFDDSAWLPAGTTASLPIGFPSAGATGLEATIQTTLTAGGYTCVFLRKTFVVNNAAAVVGLTLQGQHDDGFAAWLNGTPIGSANVAEPYTISTLASDHEVTVGEASLTPSAGLLVEGTNVLAVQVFNVNTTSSDLFLDVRLTSDVDVAPTIASLDPPASAIVQALTIINVAFSENVSGVNAADLLINSVAATNVIQNNPRDYTFYFPQPATGTVNVAWIPNPGINDIDGLPTAFVPGPAWSYTLDPNIIASEAVISEFLADNEDLIYNGREVKDEDGTRSDYIELYNPGLVEVSLNGWYLTDTSTNLTKWRIPNVVLGPNKYLLIWASEKNRANSSAPLHTNFRLSRNAGSYLALVRPSGTAASVFSGATYPAQLTDISYGRDRVDPNLTGYFIAPTPGAQNTVSGTGFAPEPTLSLESGVYTNASLTLTIIVPPNTTVRYTIDGTMPTNTSTAYTAPITFNNNRTIKLRAYPSAAGLFPSPVVARNFLFLDGTTTDFNSNIPVLILSTEGRAMVQGVASGFPRTKGTFVVFDTFRGRSSFSRKPDYIGPADFEVFGQTSAGFAKQPYNVELQDAAGNDQRESILGLPAEADWKLRNPHADKCLMNDFLAYEMFDEMGNYSCRRRMVEVFVDTGGGRLSYPGDYIGVEVFLEKIERGSDRVDIAELTPSQTAEPDVTGGWMFKDDKDSPGDINLAVNTGGNIANTLKIHEPKPQSLRNTPSSAITSYPGPGYTPSASNQLTWLMRYFAALNTSLNGAGFELRTGTNHYAHYLDVDSFVDNHWVVEFPKQIDGYRISNFFSKDRNGKVKNVPIWDWNLSFGNADYLQGGLTNGWYYTQISGEQHTYLRSLLGVAALPGSGGDPDFIQKVIDRWGVLRTNIMNGDRVVARIGEIGRILTDNGAASSPALRNFAKYPGYINTYHWPNPQGPPANHVDYTQPTYDLIISEMQKWTAGRYLWVDSQFPQAPTLGIPEGGITAGATLAMTAPAGTIYYTLNGTDPRRSQATGAVSSAAITYSTPVTLNGNARVFARARVGTVWSPPSIATYVVQLPRLVITEIMYHPLPPGHTNNIDEDFEYIEFKNVGTTPLNVGGFTLSGGVEFTFPVRTLAVGERVVVVRNQAAFLSRYPGLAGSIAGQFTGNLANEGNRLVLRGSLSEPILDFEYDDQWHPITDGFGFSLVIVDDTAPVNTWGLGSSWRPGGTLNGTPGQDESVTTAIPQVVISEALSHSDVPGPTNDVIELSNLSGGPANVGGWYLTDDFREPQKFRIPLGTAAIPAGGTLTFDEDDFNVGTNSFSLSSSGDEVYLFSANAAGELTGYVHGFEFGAQRTGVTFVRHVNSQSDEHFVASSSPTLGTPNAPVLIGPVVITEIMYRPPEVFVNGANWNNSEDEFVELRNISGAPVSLFDPDRRTNTWKLDQAVEFSFPTNVTIPAGGYVLVVNFNPATNPSQLAAFRTKYGLTPATPIFGPYQGDLSNGDETVTLYRPDVPEDSGANSGEVPYVVVDEVHYSDLAPWPVGADGYGPSLQRVVESNYGNDPANWTAVGPSAGRTFISGGIPPSVTSQPTGITLLTGSSGNLSVAASGTEPFFYQWRINGATLSDGPYLSGANGPVLTFPALQANQAGAYSVIIFNSGGSVESGTAEVRVLFPPNIVVQPTNRAVRIRPDPASAPTTNVTFTAVATSANSQVAYQWRFNGVNIPGATSSTLMIPDVQLDEEGDYSAAISDSVTTVYSATARLSPWISPIVIQPPLSQTVVEGSDFAASVEVTGNPMPFAYSWRRGSIVVATNSGNYRSNFINLNTTTAGLILTNNIQSSNYQMRLVVYNAANNAPGVLAVFTNTVLADFDGDGIPNVVENDLGMATNNPADAALDADGDGMNNRSEYQAGTDPASNLSYLRIEQGPGAATVSVAAVSNRTYTVQFSDSLSSGAWSRLGDIVAKPNNRVVSFTDAGWNTNRFYRVALPQQP